MPARARGGKLRMHVARVLDPHPPAPLPLAPVTQCQKRAKARITQQQWGGAGSVGGFRGSTLSNSLKQLPPPPRAQARFGSGLGLGPPVGGTPYSQRQGAPSPALLPGRGAVASPRSSTLSQAVPHIAATPAAAAAPVHAGMRAPAAAPAPPPPTPRGALGSFVGRFVARTAQAFDGKRRERMEEELREKRERWEAERAREHAELARRIRLANELTSRIAAVQQSGGLLAAFRSRAEASASELGELEGLAAHLISGLEEVEAVGARLDKELNEELSSESALAEAKAHLESDVQGAASSLAKLLQRAALWRPRAEAAAADAAVLEEEIGAALWRVGVGEEDELVLQEAPEAHAHIAPLLTHCAKLGGSTAKLVSKLAAGEARAAESEPTVGELRRRIEAIPGGSVGQAAVSLRPLSADEEDQVDDALALGRQKTEVLVEFMNVPVTRYDMATLRPGCWLNDEVRPDAPARRAAHTHSRTCSPGHGAMRPILTPHPCPDPDPDADPDPDPASSPSPTPTPTPTPQPSPSLSPQVINLFFKLLEDREAKAAAAKAAGRTGDPLTQAPRCHFCQTNFYTKLVGGGYDYKQVRRWTKKVRHVPKHACMHACIQWSAGGRRRGGSESRPTRPGSASTSCAAPLPTIGQRSPPS